MKVLHICTGWPLSLQGGITNYVRYLAETQYKNGIDVYVLGRKDEQNYDFHYIEFDSKIRPFTCSKLEDKKSLKQMEDFFNREKFDIIHIHALEYVDWDIYSIVKNYNYVVSLHDYCFICPRIYMYTDGKVCGKYDEKKCSNCIGYLERIRGYKKITNLIGCELPHLPQNITKIRYAKFSELLNNASYLLPVSSRVDEIYKASGITNRSKVLHIGNVSADEFTDDYTYDTSDHILKIVFLGRLTEYKGADLFIKIANDLKDVDNVEFHFLGNSAEYAQKLKMCGIIDHGKYNQSDLGNILKEFDMGMVLSIWEDNGPQVVMELLNNHIPVIGTKMGGISDFVNDKNGFIFDPYSSNEINALYKFIKELTPCKVNELKKNIKRTVTPLEHYKELMNVYEMVLRK